MSVGKVVIYWQCWPNVQVKLYGKRGVYKDSKLEELGGKIFQKDGILYNCVFSLSDKGRELNEYNTYHTFLSVASFVMRCLR